MPRTHDRAMLEIRLAEPRDRLALYRMLELYQYDLSEIWDQDLDAHGEYGYALDRYWQDAHSIPYVFTVSSQYAGFALVDKHFKLPGGEFWMDQFFVLKKYRRQRVATHAATHVFSRHPGAWQIEQMTENSAAQAFWRKLIAEFSEGQYEEHQLISGGWQGYVQCFRSAGRSGV